MYYEESKRINNLYMLPSSLENREIMYSPLRGTAFMVDSNTAYDLMCVDNNNPLVEEIAAKLSSVNPNLDQSPDITIDEISQNLVILLSNCCNLGCKYCYAQFEREDGFISKQKIQTVVDFVLKRHQNSHKLISISFLGGGEPTLNWSLLVWAIEYTIKQATSLGVQIRIGFPTNATLLNSERIDFLVKNNVEIGVSFELLPDIQDEQRPFAHSDKSTYNVVAKNVRLLHKKGIQCRFRSTITPTYVHRMEEMVKHVANNFPYINKIHFEPIYPLVESENNTFDADVFYNKFIDNFMKARYIGDSCGINVTTAATNILGKIKPRYCRGELCVTPSGDLVICHRSSSEKDVRFKKFKYGFVSDNGLMIDDAQFQAINQLLSLKDENCNNCFSKWHCSGMCLSNREMFTEKQRQSYCSYVRKIEAIYIEYILQKGGVINESDRSFCE